jgi:hypothetical protein
MPSLICIIIQNSLDRHDDRCQKSQNQQDGYVRMGDDEALGPSEA